MFTLWMRRTRTLIEKGIDAALIPHDASDKDSNARGADCSGSLRRAGGDVAFVVGSENFPQAYIKELHAALAECE